MSNERFVSDLRKFAEKTKRSLDQTCRAVSIKWFSATILSTPVDTGRLRGNWQVTQGAPAGGITARLDPSGQGIIADVTQHAGGLGSLTYLVNNLEYATAIEYGHSMQAPEGMVRINFARIKSIIEQSARGNQV